MITKNTQCNYNKPVHATRMFRMFILILSRSILGILLTRMVKKLGALNTGFPESLRDPNHPRAILWIPGVVVIRVSLLDHPSAIPLAVHAGQAMDLDNMLCIFLMEHYAGASHVRCCKMCVSLVSCS